MDFGGFYHLLPKATHTGSTEYRSKNIRPKHHVASIFEQKQESKRCLLVALTAMTRHFNKSDIVN